MLSKKAEAEIKAYARKTDPRDVAHARVIGSHVDARPGPFRLLPVLAYLRKERGVVFLTLSSIMLRIVDDNRMGTLGWNIPVTERTEKSACTLLTSFGWDGRVWPIDAGWPDGLEESIGLQTLLHEGRLLATFVFPPVPQGSRVLRVDVAKMNTEFPLSPSVPVDDVVEPTEMHLTSFRRYMVEPELFTR